MKNGKKLNRINELFKVKNRVAKVVVVFGQQLTERQASKYLEDALAINLKKLSDLAVIFKFNKYSGTT